MTVEVEHGFGLVTVEVEAHYDYTTTSSFDPVIGKPTHDLEQGMENVDLGAAGAIYQYVSQDEFFRHDLRLRHRSRRSRPIPRSAKTRKSSPSFSTTLELATTSRSNRSSDIRSCSAPATMAATCERSSMEWFLDIRFLTMSCRSRTSSNTIPVFELSGETCGERRRLRRPIRFSATRRCD